MCASHLAALRDSHILYRLVRDIGPDVFNFSHNIHAVNDLPKYNVFVIEMWQWHSGDEELAAIRVRARVLLYLHVSPLARREVQSCATYSR